MGTIPTVGKQGLATGRVMRWRGIKSQTFAFQVVSIPSPGLPIGRCDVYTGRRRSQLRRRYSLCL